MFLPLPPSPPPAPSQNNTVNNNSSPRGLTRKRDVPTSDCSEHKEKANLKETSCTPADRKRLKENTFHRLTLIGKNQHQISARQQLMDPHWSRISFSMKVHGPTAGSGFYLLAGRSGLRRLPSWRGMSSAAEHHGHAGRRSSMVGAE